MEEARLPGRRDRQEVASQQNEASLADVCGPMLAVGTVGVSLVSCKDLLTRGTASWLRRLGIALVLPEEQVWWAEGRTGDAWLGQVELVMPGDQYVEMSRRRADGRVWAQKSRAELGVMSNGELKTRRSEVIH